MPSPPPADPQVPPPHGTGAAFVTGAGGFIGGHVAHALEAAGWRVAAFGDRRAEADWARGDLAAAKLEAATAELGAPQLIVHCAGTGSVGAAQTDPDHHRARTLGGLEAVLGAAGGEGARLVLLSSAAVYGEDGGEGVKAEDAQRRPISDYGRHKLEAETRALDWASGAGGDLAVVRFFSIYGPRLRKQLFWDLYRRLAAEPAEIVIGGTGDELRDFLEVADAVRLIGVLAARPGGGEAVVVNGGSGRSTSVREAAESLARAMGSKARIRFSGEQRPGNPQVLVADPGRVRALGFEPRIALDAGLDRYVAWARETDHG